MKNSFFKVCQAATFMLAAIISPSAVMADNTPVAGGTKDFTQYLVMNENSNVPETTLKYTITSGTAIDATESDPAIYEGIGKPTIADVTFTHEDTVYDEVQDSDSVTLEDGEVYAKKTATINFSGVTFTKPGIYRYVVTATSSTNDRVMLDDPATRNVDVYVGYPKDNETSNTLVVQGIVMHNSTIGSVAEADKTDGFVDTYNTNSVTISKTVSGNQADKDKYFEFTFTATGAVAGTSYNVDLSNATASGIKVEGEEEPVSNPSSLSADEGGNVTGTFYLKHGQSVTINGLTYTMHYTVEETSYAADGYTTTCTLDEVAADEGDLSCGGAVSDKDHTAAYTNHKSGIVPTGVFVSSGPFIALGGVAAVLFIAMQILKKKSLNKD